MQMVVRALAVMAALVWGSGAQAQQTVWIQLEAHPDLTSSIDGARYYAQTQGNIAGFRSGNRWYVLALGPFSADQAAQEMVDLKNQAAIPRDAFISDGAGYSDQFWPVGAAALTAPLLVPQDVPDPAPAPIAPAEIAQADPDETPAQARQSEASLSRDAREELQKALAWYGFYDAAIDGSFGRGTRASMSAWQIDAGYEPTGVLTSLQRAALVGNYRADQAEFGFETITEPEAGIEIALPTAMVAFDHYEPPFVHYVEKNGSKLRLILISEPGDAAALAGLYDILQTLDVVPAAGARSLDKDSFTINAANDQVASFAYAAASRGAIKGFLATWDPAIADKMARVLPVLQSSFRPSGDKYLDPGLVPLDDAARTGLIAGMRVALPIASGSGIFVGKEGSVLTDAGLVARCGRITIDNGTEAKVLASDQGAALLQPLAPLAPTAIAPIANQTPRLGSAVLTAGFSTRIALPAAVLSRGTLSAATGLDGASSHITLAISLNSGDVGGPVLDETGALLGMISAAPADKVLPGGVALAISSNVLAQLIADHGVASPAVQTLPLTVDALTVAAQGMTTQVACWP